MKSIFKYKYFNHLLHLLVWTFVLSFPFLISSPESQYKVGHLPGLFFSFSGLVHIVIFYLNGLYLYPKLLNISYWWLYTLLVILLIYLSYEVKLYVLVHGFPDSTADARNHVLFPSLLALIASVFYSVTIEKIRTEKLQRDNEAVRLGMELKFLRSQISPHFLFNVLTNLVYLARKRSDNLEASLLTLSGLMRYMLYDSDKKISMQQEVEYLESYISLQKMRFGSDVKITFDSDLSKEKKNNSIEPMLLIPFVENAFKHGTGVSEALIAISLKISENILTFEVKNKFDIELDKNKDETSGIGLSNVRLRLSLLYPDRHDLMIDTSNNLFKVNLTLDL